MKNKILNPTTRIVLHILFFVFAALYISADYIHVKAFGMLKIFPLLMLMALTFPQHIHDGTKKLFCGLVFGMIGDIVLKYGEGKSMVFFALGAGFFLIGHICYNIFMFTLWQIKK